MKRLKTFTLKHKKGLTLFILILVSILCLSFSSQGWLTKPKQIGQSVFSVFQISITSIKGWFARTWNSINELKQVTEELNVARQKLLEYEKISRDVVELREENKKYRELLEFVDSSSYRQIPAQIIAKDPGNFFSTIMIDRGSRHNLQEGMAVVAFQDGLQGLVGKVVQVNAITSMIKPLLDPTCYVSARLQKSRYEGLVYGNGVGADLLTMEYVSKNARDVIEYGDLVITSGLSGELGSPYPKGIYIGRIRKYEAEAYETSMQLEIEPVIDFSRLEEVFVLVLED